MKITKDIFSITIIVKNMYKNYIIEIYISIFTFSKKKEKEKNIHKIIYISHFYKS